MSHCKYHVINEMDQIAYYKVRSYPVFVSINYIGILQLLFYYFSALTNKPQLIIQMACHSLYFSDSIRKHNELSAKSAKVV